jgi:glycosyltransferase involved in cell wall biosynthesis
MEAHALSLAAAAENNAESAPLAYLVVVRKGPTWEIADLEPFCRLLSRRFAGEVWSFGSYEADMIIGRIRLRIVPERDLQYVANRVRFVRRALGWIADLRASRPPGLAFVALEPFIGGPVAWFAARRAGGALLCEVNGVYASRHNTPQALLGRLRVRLRRLVGSFVLRRANAVRVLFTDQLRDFVQLPPRVVIRQFFETTNLAAFYPGPEEHIILGVGFPFRVKGFDLLCEAFHRVAERFPDWKLVLIGFQVPETVRESGLEHPRIESHPGLKQAQIAEWMARCAIFALPSRTEAMGRVLLEAGAAGKCRLAARIEGIPTVLEDGVDGVLVPPESVDALAAALERLMGNPERRRRLGAAAQQRVGREFSAEAYLEHYAEWVSAALRSRS